nr:hypothetical protein [Candidatus Freyarchaeota archaeon]
MGNGRSTGAGVVLCLSIMGFVVCLFIFWPLAFAILFVGLAVFCALQSGRRVLPSRLPQERRPMRYQPTTPPQRKPRREPPQWSRPYPSPPSEPSSRSGVRIPVEDTETEKINRWVTEEEAEEELEEEPEVSTSIRAPLLREEPRFRTAERETALGELEEELEATRAKYKQMTTKVEKAEKTGKETSPVEQITIPDEKAERIKDLESEEEATRVILEELKGRWMSGKIDLDMYQRLKEKYEKKIKDIQKQKKRT